MPGRDLVKTFPINITSEIDDKQYNGVFSTRKMTIGMMMQMDVEKAHLTAGYSYNPVTGRGIGVLAEKLAEMIAMCSVALIQKPEWFNDPLTLIDDSILLAVWKEVNAHEGSFRAPDTAGNEQGRGGGVNGAEGDNNTSQASGSVESSQLQPGTSQTMVDQKVPSITKVG